jgi:hypothetical protein
VVAALAVVEVGKHWHHRGGCVHAVHDGWDADPVAACRKCNITQAPDSSSSSNSNRGIVCERLCG